MSEDRAKRIASVFAEARRIARRERSRFLDEACAGDGEMRREIEELLAESPPDEGLLGAAWGGESSVCGPTRPTAANELPRRVGPYALIRRIGRGGMGEVWLAEQREPIRRRVALKLVKPGMDTKEVLARFDNERQALAMMDHPNIAKVLDAGATEEGRPYFVMEYVEGVPITEHCDRRRLTTRERLELFSRVCDGIQHAHQRAIIHRDIKPSNIIVTVQGDRAIPKIIDFGIAKAIEHNLTARTLFTEEGRPIGTPEYMSPEQLTPESVDTRTDVYSLGVLLYELLVGALPFEGRELRAAGFDEIRRKIREDEPSKPSTRVSTLGDGAAGRAEKRRTDPVSLSRQLRGDLDWITMAALAKDRSRRYGSPRELADDVERHLNRQPVAAGPPSVAYRFTRFVQRNRVGVAVAGVVALTIVLGALGTTLGLVRAVRAEAIAKQEAALARAEGYRANIRAADASLRLEERLDAAQYLSLCVPDLRGWEWRHLKFKTDQRVAVFENHEYDVASVGFDPTARYVVAASGKTIHVWDMRSGENVLTMKDERPISMVAYSPDASRIVSQRADFSEIRVWDARSGALLSAIADPDRNVWVGDVSFAADGTLRNVVRGASLDSLAPAFDERRFRQEFALSPDGGVVAALDRDGTIALRRATSGALPGRAALKMPSVAGLPSILAKVVAFSEDGGRVAAGGATGVLAVWETAPQASALPRILGDGLERSSAFTALAFSPDGERLASGHDDRAVRMWDVESKALLAAWHGHSEAVTAVSFSSDASRVVSGSRDRTVRVWDAGSTSHSAWTLSPDDGSRPHGRIHRSVMSRDATTAVLAFSPGEAIEVWSIAKRERLATLKGHAARDVAVSANGSRVASGGGNEAWIWDVKSERQTAVLPHDSGVLSVAISLDGSRVASADQSAVHLWDANTGAAISRFVVDHPRGPMSLEGTLVFSNDGDRIALGSGDGTVRVWSTASGEQLAKIKAAPKIIWTLAFSPDGDRVVTGSADQLLRVWDVARGEELFELFGHDDHITSVTYSPDGTRLLSSSFDTDIRIWDAATGDLLLVLGESQIPITAIGFNEDGTEMITLAFEEVRVWRAI